MTEINQYVAFLEGQPWVIRDAVQCRLFMLLVREGSMDLCSVMAGDVGPFCVFQDRATGHLISVMVPLMNSDK